MRDRPEPKQEILRLIQSLQAGGEIRPQTRVGQYGNRSDGGHVAQRARRFFEVGFELVDRVIEVGMTLLGQLPQRFESLPAPRRPGAVTQIPEPFEDMVRSRQGPRVQHGQQELGVVRFHFVKLFQRSDLMPDLQLQIPQRMEHGLEKPLLRSADLSVEDEEQVDVRMQTELPSSIPTHRKDRPRDLRPPLSGVADLMDQLVDLPGKAVKRACAASGLARGRRQLDACRLEQASQTTLGVCGLWLGKPVSGHRR